MKFIISRYNQDIGCVKEYSDDVVIYDRSDEPVKGAIVVPNVGTDIYDKLTFIIDNYDNLPNVAVYTKANLFKYCPKDEFNELIKKTSYTPLLSTRHKVYEPICRYTKDGLYEEKNDFWYLNSHPTKNKQTFEELKELLTFNGRDYLQFCPGSNYLLTREDILRHPKSLYDKLRFYLEWTVYPGEAQMIERGLHYLWGSDIIKV